MYSVCIILQLVSILHLATIFSRKNGFVYQYLEPTLYSQELQGYLNITNNSNILEVFDGLCQDFFGFTEVTQII